MTRMKSQTAAPIRKSKKGKKEMAKYTIEITARYEIETDSIDEVRLNYDTPTLEYCETIKGEPEFLDGTFSYEDGWAN